MRFNSFMIALLALQPMLLVAADNPTNAPVDVDGLSGAVQLINEGGAVIHDAAGLSRHLRDVPDSPINRLDPSLRELFLSSLVFTRHGLASFSMVPFDGLSVEHAYDILALFGNQTDVGEMDTAPAQTAREEAMLLVSRAVHAQYVQ